MRVGLRRRAKVLLVVFVTVAYASSFARADWKDFVPRPFENGAFIDTYSSYEHDNIHSGAAASSRWTDTFIKEKLTLFSNGYSYHPRFVQYRFSISGVLKQEDFESSYSSNSSGWMNDSGLEYDMRLFFLPEHVYNATAYAARFEPLFKEQAASQHSSVETTQGASFRYRKKPYFLHTGYGDDHIESGLTTSDIQRFFLDGEYFNRFTNGNEVSVSGAFNPSWFTATGGVDGNTYQYLLGNLVNLQRVRLTSTLSKVDASQQNGSLQSFNNDQLSWYELLTAYLPWNFRSDFRYLYQNNDSTIEEPGTQPGRNLNDTTNDIELDIVHRLYESLDTTYTFLDSWRDSSGGNTSFLGHSLTLNYAKQIPWGRFLAGTNVATGETDSSGQINIVNEPYPAVPVPGSITLRQPNADPTTIVVLLKSPLPPFQLIQLVENVDYTVIPVQNTFEVRIFNLPPQFVVPGTYDFLLSYSLAGGSFNLRTNTYGGNVSTQLFDDLLTPYFNYVAVRTDVLSGEFPGVPLDSTTYTTGLLLHRGPVRVRGEYQDFQWDAAPYTAWLADVQYASALDPTTSVFAAVSYLNKHYTQGTIVYYGNVTDYTEESTTGSCNIQKQLFERSLFLSAGGSYSRINGLVDTNAYSGNGSLIWRIGKVEVTVGASAYGSDSSGANTVSTRRDHELVYVKFRRQLF
jgi:hypothetical protein